MGTIVSDHGWGVAPGASWITCRGCWDAPDGYSGCLNSDVLACAEFMLCPTNPTGQVKYCSKAPRVVNNSWAGNSDQNAFFQNAVDAWQKAGIIPVFGAGNFGPTCSRTPSPADYANVVAVGATDKDENLADFSSRGPLADGRIKPEITAPGTAIFSTWYRNDNSYSTQQGTSMAAPHVTGVIALMLSAAPTLTFNQVRQILIDTAERNALQPTSEACSSTNGVFPNNMYGYGRVNALQAVIKAQQLAPPPTPVPGQCMGLNESRCEGTFFCT